jgi:hypothetical protein
VQSVGSVRRRRPHLGQCPGGHANLFYCDRGWPGLHRSASEAPADGVVRQLDPGDPPCVQQICEGEAIWPSYSTVDYCAPRRLDKALFRQLGTYRWIAERRGLLVTGPCGITEPTTTPATTTAVNGRTSPIVHPAG